MRLGTDGRSRAKDRESGECRRSSVSIPVTSERLFSFRTGNAMTKTLRFDELGTRIRKFVFLPITHTIRKAYYHRALRRLVYFPDELFGKVFGRSW